MHMASNQQAHELLLMPKSLLELPLYYYLSNLWHRPARHIIVDIDAHAILDPALRSILNMRMHMYIRRAFTLPSTPVARTGRCSRKPDRLRPEDGTLINWTAIDLI